jgi:hypothetical protein
MEVSATRTVSFRLRLLCDVNASKEQEHDHVQVQAAKPSSDYVSSWVAFFLPFLVFFVLRC